MKKTIKTTLCVAILAMLTGVCVALLRKGDLRPTDISRRDVSAGKKSDSEPKAPVGAKATFTVVLDPSFAN